MIKVMVADDNIELNSMCCNFLTNDKEIEIVSRTIDGESTLKNYLDLKPDVLLLDLDLPKLNGLDIINSLCLNSEEKNKCNIIVISGNIDMRHNLFNTSKIYRIIPKPASFDYILNIVKEMTSDKDLLFQKNLKDLLLDLKFNLYSTGTVYLIDAINIAYTRPVLLRNIKDLYVKIGTKYDVPYKKVKWSIRNSIDTMNKYISTDFLHSIFHIYETNYKITPKYFLTMIIEYLENDM